MAGAVHLNHTIVPARDRRASAAFLAEILGLPAPEPFGHFMGVRLDNGVTLDFMDVEGDPEHRHYAFLIGEETFDAVFARLRVRNLPYWADPGHRQAGTINTRDGGRGVYFDDPDGHSLEVITRPYGGGAGLA